MILLSCVMVISSGFIRANEDNPELNIFYGEMFRIADSYYIIPAYTDYISSTNEQASVEENVAGFRVELSSSSSVPRDGNTCLVVGDINHSSGCITSVMVQRDMEWMTGKMKDGRLSIYGKEYVLVWGENAIIKGDMNGSIYVFGRKYETTITAYAICPKNDARTTITGVISEVKDNSITIDKKDGQGRSARVTQIRVPLQDNTIIFEGRNKLSPAQVIAGRICACRGILDYSKKEMNADILICNAYQATDSGRLIGLTDEFDGEFMRIKTSINSSIPINLKIATHAKSWVIMDERILTPDDMKSIPTDRPVEIIGVFSKSNCIFIADVIAIEPDGITDFVFGSWDEESTGIIDFNGVLHPVEITDHTWFDSPGGDLSEGRFAQAWMTPNETIACYVPQIGILGVRVTGWFQRAYGDYFELECHSAMDSDLQGKVVEVVCSESCQAIRGGQGPVDIKSIPTDTFMHCWGIPNKEGKFWGLMISVH